MPCFSPMLGYRSDSLTENGKRKIVFAAKDALGIEKRFLLTIACGQCIGCRLERSRQWAVRCVHEASMYDDNCFITLTYDDAKLPDDYSISDGLQVRHFQLFMKRFRKEFGDGIRYFHCGEYGEKFGRPHYHACIFNFDFPDKEKIGLSNGLPLYESAILNRLWPYGMSRIGTMTFESAAYVARYILKKKFGTNSYIPYSDIDWTTGEVLFTRAKEYVTMSRRPGIGKTWIDKYMDDTYKDDFVVLDGRKSRPPRYYDSQFEITSPSLLEKLKIDRKKNAAQFADNNTPDRLEDREYILRRKLKICPRTLDEVL